jgi:hypothetical protein
MRAKIILPARDSGRNAPASSRHIDLDALIACAKLAEDIVGHPLPGAVMKGGTLERFRTPSS